MTKQYELTYTVPKNLAPEETSGLSDRVFSYFPQATILEKGFDFFSLEFYTEPETLGDLEKKLKSETQIKRYLIVRKEALKPMKTRRMPPAKIPAVAEQKVEKAELKEIDEKLKEIFGE